MHCWSLLLLAIGCVGQEKDDPLASDPEASASIVSEETQTDEDVEEEEPRDIPQQDTAAKPEDTGAPPEIDTGTPSDDATDTTPFDVDIEPGHRWMGRFTPSLMFGEIRWETANPDGTRCLIEGLMTDIVQHEESCSDCDFGVQFTLVGLIVLLDEGACDRSVLAWEGQTFEYGHGYTQTHTDLGSDVFDLYRSTEDGWTLLEHGYSQVESSDVVWAFGEELHTVTDSDSP